MAGPGALSMADNAKIYSVKLDGTEIHAQAAAIKDGKFAYVGDEAGVAYARRISPASDWG